MQDSAQVRINEAIVLGALNKIKPHFQTNEYKNKLYRLIYYEWAWFYWQEEFNGNNYP